MIALYGNVELQIPFYVRRVCHYSHTGTYIHLIEPYLEMVQSDEYK